MSIEKIASSTTMNLSKEYQSKNSVVPTIGPTQDNVKNSEEQVNSNSKIDSKKKIQEAVDSINKFLEPKNTHIKFELHEKLDEYYVTIVNNETNEVVKEIPSKKILDIHAAMTEFLGFIVDKKI